MNFYVRNLTFFEIEKLRVWYRTLMELIEQGGPLISLPDFQKAHFEGFTL